jgi:hypothetical protein
MSEGTKTIPAAPSAPAPAEAPDGSEAREGEETPEGSTEAPDEIVDCTPDFRLKTCFGVQGGNAGE